jgi:hypothetical protein
MVLSFVPVTHAYGNTALWQIGFAFTCNSPQNPACGGAKSGDWGWVEFGTGGQGDAQVTAYFNSPGLKGVGPGLIHLAISITSWGVDSKTGVFTLNSGSAVATGGAIRGHVDIPDVCSIGFCGDTPFPAAPGHYTAQSLFGFSPGPGYDLQIQVVQLH